MGLYSVDRKILLASLLVLSVLCIGIGITLNTKSLSETCTQTGERVPFNQVVIGNGTGEMGGYYGWVINPDRKYWFSRHFYAKVLPSADIYSISLLGNASGYKTVLVTAFLEYDPLRVRRVTVSHRVILYPNNVSIWFNIIVLENGYATFKVNSDYFLRDDWMRTVFTKMLQDIQLPTNAISHFELHVNWIAHTCGRIE